MEPTPTAPPASERPDERPGERFERYDPAAVEPKWRQSWRDQRLYEDDLTDTSRPNF